MQLESGFLMMSAVNVKILGCHGTIVLAVF
jgi:hypothetical protein